MSIDVLTHAPRAYTYDDGAAIHDLIAPVLARGEVATVSFAGVDAVSTSFVNGAFIDLLERFDFDFIKRHLRVVKSTGQINRTIKERFAFEAGRRRPTPGAAA